MGSRGTLQTGTMPHAQQDSAARVAVENACERAQVMLQNVPRIEIPGIPNACRELYSLEGAEEFGLDPARCLHQSHYVAGTKVIVGEGV